MPASVPNILMAHQQFCKISRSCNFPFLGYRCRIANRSRPIAPLLFVLALGLCVPSASAQTYDLVIHGGRVIDPETNLDAVRDIGINGAAIAAISTQPLQGKRIIQAGGLVVAPGFIDLHEHAQTPESYRLKAFDGVTTALEMEIGASDVTIFLSSREGRALINFGTTANYDAARALAFNAPLPPDQILPLAGPATNDPATPQQIETMENRLRSEFDAGALGLGMGIQYAPGATRSEVIRMFVLAAQHHLPVYTHVRSAGRIEPGSSVESVSEVIAAAAISGAPLHIVHINSSCMKDAPECLDMIAGARGRGLDVTTEAYPYTAGMTLINSAVFNPGWQQKFGVGYDHLQLPDTGERLTKQRFDELRASKTPQTVLLFQNDDATVDAVIRNPLVMIASDGLMGHPRNAGAYCRILARYVREQRSLTLSDAIRKMSFMPAQMLERSTPAAEKKGRLQIGADADIDVFDLNTVSDRATYAHPREPSVGMQYVLVGGTVIIDAGKIVPNIFPGKGLRRDHSQ